MRGEGSVAGLLQIKVGDRGVGRRGVLGDDLGHGDPIHECGAEVLAALCPGDRHGRRSRRSSEAGHVRQSKFLRTDRRWKAGAPSVVGRAAPRALIRAR